MNTLGELGEHEVIRRLVEKLGDSSDLVVGAGDDCAVVAMPGSTFHQVFTTDPVVEGVHFLPTHEPERIGHKAVGRVLSDIAAMGASPQWVLVNVVAAPDLDVKILEGIYDGMTALCRQFGATVIGGDLAQGPTLEVHVFGSGILPAGSALLRSGACPGDVIFVSGPLGGSAAGRHLDFLPRVEEGCFLRESGCVGALMDISDGLATDLRHLLSQSGVGAVLDADRIPSNGSLESALFDGEDFELLFTVRPERVDKLVQGWGARFAGLPCAIGKITTDLDRLCLRFPDGREQLVEGKAFEHFKD